MSLQIYLSVILWPLLGRGFGKLILQLGGTFNRNKKKINGIFNDTILLKYSYKNYRSWNYVNWIFMTWEFDVPSIKIMLDTHKNHYEWNIWTLLAEIVWNYRLSRLPDCGLRGIENQAEHKSGLRQTYERKSSSLMF